MRKRLYCLDRSLDGGRADIHVPEPNHRHHFVAGHERDLAGVDARDSRLCAGHGDGERLVWFGSELDPRRKTMTRVSYLWQSRRPGVDGARDGGPDGEDGRVRGHSDVGVDVSLAIFHEVCLGVGKHNLVGRADAGKECAVDGGRKELRSGFAREEDPVLDGHADLPA